MTAGNVRLPDPPRTAAGLLGWAIEFRTFVSQFIADTNNLKQSRYRPVDLFECTVATLPSVTKVPRLIYVSDETGGATLAFSDGTNWRRVQDRAIVS